MAPLHRAGYVALVGRPNVGKSTLLNALVGQKLAIVTPKPQTTRDAIVGIKNVEGAQIVFVDTPGLHPARGLPLNDRMREEARRAIADADLVLLLTEASTAPGRAGPHAAEDQVALDALGAVDKPVLLVVTKVDRARHKEALLPQIERLSRVRAFEAVVPTSATRGVGLGALVREIVARLPESPPYFPDEMVTDRAERFLAAELVREQITLRTRAELPYSVAVVVESWQDGVLPPRGGQKPRMPQPFSRIHATIHVAKPSQKAIVVGKGGAMLKAVGTAARKQIEEMVGHKVHLELFVRVTENWMQSDELGGTK